MITAALEGKLDEAEYVNHPIFGVAMPTSCPDVPNEILNSRDTWKDKDTYDMKANELARQFNQNFEKFAKYTYEEIQTRAPKVKQKA